MPLKKYKTDAERGAAFTEAQKKYYQKNKERKTAEKRAQYKILHPDCRPTLDEKGERIEPKETDKKEAQRIYNQRAYQKRKEKERKDKESKIAVELQNDFL